MGGPCLDGGGTFEECLLEGELEGMNYITECNNSRADFVVYDIVNLSDGTALFYERSKKLEKARVSRFDLRIGSLLGEAIVDIGGCGCKIDDVVSFVLNDKLMGRRR